MESLGSILQGIRKRISSLPTGSMPDSVGWPTEVFAGAVDLTACHRCYATGWYSKKLDVSDPDFGKCFPCSCQNDSAKVAARRLAYAEIPHVNNPRTFDTFQPRDGADEAVRAAKTYTVGDGSQLLTLYGTYGSGKSHLLEAMAREMCGQGIWVKYALAPTLLDALRNSYGEEATVNFEQTYSRYANAPVLFLDDVGLGKPSEWALEKLTMLIDDRYRHEKPLVAATNLRFEALADRWGGRLADRLWDTESRVVRVVLMTCSSYRR